MKRKQIDAILINEKNRRKSILIYICTIVFIALISILFIFIYVDKNKVQYAKYSKKGNIDYNVYLKENDYFDYDRLGTDKQYISSLIEYISADFDYNLLLDSKDVNYLYSYKVVAEVKVLDKDTKKPLILKNEELLGLKEKKSSEQSVNINENILIDYNHYNDIIKRFIFDYNLNNVESYLDVNLYVNVVGSCDEFVDSANNNSIMTISIPLAVDTVDISLSNNLLNNNNNVMLCSKNSKYSWLFILSSLILIGIDLIIVWMAIKFEYQTRSAETIYERKLRKILNNYGSYIQKADNSFNLTGYKAMFISKFTDLLEIRDTVQQPILMVEQVNNTGVYFIIPSNTKILYVYGLKINDIRDKMKK